MNEEKSLVDIMQELESLVERFNDEIKGVMEQFNEWKNGSLNTELTCPFKRGDRVLVRDRSDQDWKHGHFWALTTDRTNYPYRVRRDNDFELTAWRYCIPFNDDTFNLLGTTNSYDEKGGE